jgi:hypothetical protein
MVSRGIEYHVGGQGGRDSWFAKLVLFTSWFSLAKFAKHIPFYSIQFLC